MTQRRIPLNISAGKIAAHLNAVGSFGPLTVMPGRGSFIRWNKAILRSGPIRLEYSNLFGQGESNVATKKALPDCLVLLARGDFLTGAVSVFLLLNWHPDIASDP